MKGIDIFCASQAATAIHDLLSMDEGSSSSSSSSETIHLGGGRAIDRYNPIIRDPRRFGKTLPQDPSCSFQPTINPQPIPHPHTQQNKNVNIVKPYSKANPPENSKSNNNKKNKKINHKNSTNVKLLSDEKRKSSSDDIAVANDKNNNSSSSAFGFVRKSWSCSSKSFGDLISPPGSSRYLLSDQAAFFNVISDFDPVLKSLPPVEPSSKSNKALQKDESSCAFKPSSSSRSPDQVVVLRVSLHCKGCERKMRKHISRMEGVSSFNIDFAAKKVTVAGNVTPLDVLASISKVKNAQLWTPPAPAMQSFSQINSSEINKNNHETIISS